MSITVTVIRDPVSPGPTNGVVADVQFDNSYPANGYPILPAQLNLTSIHWLEARQKGVGNRIVEFDYVGDGRFRIFSALGTEVAGGSDQSSITVRCLALGPHK